MFAPTLSICHRQEDLHFWETTVVWIASAVVILSNLVGSLYRCRKCQKPHHTLLHLEVQNDTSSNSPSLSQVQWNTAVKLKSGILLMTCRVLVTAPDGSTAEARALLDNASSASFVSEWLAQSLSRSFRSKCLSLGSDLSHKTPIQSIANFKISAAKHARRKIDITAVIVPKVTCGLPLYPIPFDLKWKHIFDLPLADPGFGQPWWIDIQSWCLCQSIAPWLVDRTSRITKHSH